MFQTFPFSSGPATLSHQLRTGLPYPEGTTPGGTHHFRSRIGADHAGGFFPAAHRYQMFLSPGCPGSLRVAITLDLLRLRGSITTTLVGPPEQTPSAFASLRSLYDATRYHYDGPLTVPALCDRWSGRVVSNHPADILQDLADHFTDQNDPHLPRLRPAALAADIDAIRELADEDITEAARRAGAAPSAQRQGEALKMLFGALELIDRQLARRPFVLGEELTAADVDLWVALVHLHSVHRLHLDPDTVHLISRHDRLWSYVLRLHSHPAFRGNLRPDHITRLHRCSCRGPESSGAAVPLPGVLRTGPA
jgi:glutathionyl-hydroquinone reductase